MIKIAVIGAGNAGCFTALQLKDIATEVGLDAKIEIIYDPTKPAEKVGQATFPHHPHLLWNILPDEFNWYKNQIDATLKTGILYEGWGKLNDKIFHPFASKNVGMHFYPKKLQEFIVNSKVFDIKHADVKDYSEVDADYIFDCRGKPDTDENYSPLVSPVDSCLLAKPKWDTSKLSYTRAVATHHGWTFILPTRKDSPSSQGSLGYLFNKNITEKREAINNLYNMFDAYITDHIEFKNYLADEPVIDQRIFLNGNRLYFLEPLEATASWINTEWVIQCWTQMIRKEDMTEHLTKWIHQKIHEIEKFILFHYQTGSQYNTRFWKHARNLRLGPDDNFEQLQSIISRYHVSTIKKLEAKGTLHEYGCWAPSSLKYWHDGTTKKN